MMSGEALHRAQQRITELEQTVRVRDRQIEILTNALKRLHQIDRVHRALSDIVWAESGFPADHPFSPEGAET